MGILGASPDRAGAFRCVGSASRSFASVLMTSLVACDGADPAQESAVDIASGRPRSLPRSPSTSPTPPALPVLAPPTSGPPTGTCDDGWATPPAGTPPFTDPLGTGPSHHGGARDHSWSWTCATSRARNRPRRTRDTCSRSSGGTSSSSPRTTSRSRDGSSSRSRRFGRGVVAVAPYDTEGFESPDWIGFQYDSAHTAGRLSGSAGGMVGDPVRLRSRRGRTQDSGPS